MLRDKRGKHKGCAYVELVRGEDVITATMLSNQVPDFQRFPILIKPSEAEKNHVSSKAQTSLAASQLRLNVDTTPLLDEKTGAVVQAQKVYVGSLSPGTTQVRFLFVRLKPNHIAFSVWPLLSRCFPFLSFALTLILRNLS
jgi:RNA-binding protein 39